MTLQHQTQKRLNFKNLEIKFLDLRSRLQLDDRVLSSFTPEAHRDDFDIGKH